VLRSNRAAKRPRSKPSKNDIQTEYDFSGGIRGKYADGYQAGTNVVLLDAVNDALRTSMAAGVQAKRRDR